MKKFLSFSWLIIVSTFLYAEVVHVYTVQDVGGTLTRLNDVTWDTGNLFTTVVAPAIDGYIFTGWTIDTLQPLASRDVWGRSRDSVSFTVTGYAVDSTRYNMLTSSPDDA